MTLDYGTLFQTVNTNLTDAITDVLPLALGVFAALAAIGIGMKIFKKVGAR